MLPDYFSELPVAVTICDKEGIILYMNEKATKTFANYGGRELIGKSLFTCHKDSSSNMIRKMMETDATNTYTIEKAGVKKMIHQAPWKVNGEVQGMIEFSIELPAQMPHFIRS